MTLMLMLAVMTSCTQRKTSENSDTGLLEFTAEMDAFLSFAGHFSENSSFAFADVGGVQVLLVSQETFGNNINSDREAIEASVFALDSKSKIISLGSVRSQGTLYPVSLLDGKLMVAGHQFVRIYSIRGKVPELVLDSYGEGEGPELEAWFKTFEKGAPIKFSKDCKTASTANTELEPLSIFDKLAGDMVYVEQNTGSFHICKYEVTQKLWSAVMEENPSDMQGDDLPVEQVSWNDCQRFISKLNELTGKKYRLPSDAEWEYACRGGNQSKGYAYSGSNDIGEVAWYDGNSEGRTHPVGQKLPNELGLYDMSGNVWEWCQDMHESVGSCRGGSWIHNARNCDPSLPNETPQTFSINSLGLRLAL